MKKDIKPLTYGDFDKLFKDEPFKEIDDLEWYSKKDFKWNLKDDEIDLIKKVSDKKYKEYHIKTINNAVPVYLSDKEEHSNTIVINEEDIRDYIKRLETKIAELENEFKNINNAFQKQDMPEDLRASLDKELTEIIQRKELLKHKIENLKKALEQNKGKNPIIYKDRYSRLGYYTRKGDEHNPEIILLMETIREIDETLLIPTYIHEMFHAYYDWSWVEELSKTNLAQANKKFAQLRSRKYIEEPLSEYAMLKFLKKFVDENPKYDTILKNAAQNVRKKQASLGICHYGFGYYLWKWEQDGNEPLCDWIECYKEAKFKIAQTQDKDEFDSPFTKGLYPFGDEHHYMALLYKILMEANGEQTGSIEEIEKTIENKSNKITQWHVLAPNALAAIDTYTHTLYLDGAFVGRQFNRKINRFVRDRAAIVARVILWDHFVCDNFNRISSYKKRIVAISPHNFYYKMKAGVPVFRQQ